MYEAAAARKPKSWNEVEDGFLRAMQGFDANVASGLADQGDRQNGKRGLFCHCSGSSALCYRIYGRRIDRVWPRSAGGRDRAVEELVETPR